MIEPNDWRITNQENYLRGVTLTRRLYRQNAKNLQWDHDHCNFCFATFSLLQQEGALREGYCTLDDYHWICLDCFEDFKELFEWKTIDSTKLDNGA